MSARIGNFEVVIGLEVHTQLATKSKLFSSASTEFGAAPNSQACAVDIGLPGVLPVLNAEAVRMAVVFGLAIGAHISPRCVFDRKNYFYPDLPKGYQISQYKHPIVGAGTLSFHLPDGSARSIRITRAHLEEDAGKSVHDLVPGYSAIDLNRAGTPLLEIVTEPELYSPEEAVACLKRLHALVRYLGICDGNMNEGSFRCDANVSLRPIGTNDLGERTEIKNVNSFRFVERAIVCEMERQESILSRGGVVERQTMLYDEVRDETRAMRGKEAADDYRYFPEPDLLPLEITAEFIRDVQATLPELPEAKRARFQRDYQLSDYDAAQLTEDRALSEYFEHTVEIGGDAKQAANWIMGEVAAHLNRADSDIAHFPVTAAALGHLILRLRDGTLSSKTAKTLFEALCARNAASEARPLDTAADVDALIEAKGLKQMSDSGALTALVAKVVTDHPSQVADYQGSDEAKRKKKLGFFVGQIMKASGGKANPQQVNELLLNALK